MNKNYLTQLADKHKTDKGSIKHNYTEIYEVYFSKFKNEKFNMLEIGYCAGASCKMWLEYFPNVTLYSVDIFDKPPMDKTIEQYIECGKLIYKKADQSTKELETFIKSLDVSFKVMIDDGSHVSEDQQFSFGYLFKFVEDGGLYIIEDLNCKRNPSSKFKVQAEKRTVDFLKDYNVTDEFKSLVLPKTRCAYLNKNVFKVEVYLDKISFITKESSWG